MGKSFTLPLEEIRQLEKIIENNIPNDTMAVETLIWSSCRDGSCSGTCYGSCSGDCSGGCSGDCSGESR